MKASSGSNLVVENNLTEKYLKAISILEKINNIEFLDKNEKAGEREVYIYRRNLINPFRENNKKRITGLEKEKMKEIIPFKLRGIIETGKEIIALIELEEKNKIIKKGEEIKDYYIKEIDNEFLLVEYENYFLKLNLNEGFEIKELY